MKRFAVTAALLAFWLPSAAQARVSVAQVPGSLPKTVVPVLYDMSVAPDIASMKIAGRERIVVTVLKPVGQLVLDALNTNVNAATLDGAKSVSITSGPAPQTIALRFGRTIRPGRHILRLVYTAKLETSAQGLFAQSYRDENGKPAQMLGTQFEVADARRMFPSFDEPVFRARFHLTATVPSNWTAVSNMPITATRTHGALKDVTFATTPSMSTYLLVLCAGDFDKLSGSANGVAINVYGTRGKGAELGYALSSLERLIPYFETYYGIKFPLPKLDLIAIPGFFGGAMENWGGMTFQEDTAVYNPKLQPPTAQRGVFDIIAHETSHQWNGDLVTMGWWDSTWLNEGFATWMENKATADMNPSWNWQLRFDSANNGTMNTDALRTTHPVHMPVRNETEANEIFDDLSYQKAGAFLRMIEAFIGPQVFRKGLHNYFVANEYGNTVPPDLWSQLSAVSHRDIASIAHAWIEKPGFPVVHISTVCAGGKRTATLTQNRYTSFASSDTTTWSIPVNMETAPGHFTRFLVDRKRMTVTAGSCSQPLILNGNDTGYYRVAYDAGQEALQRTYFKQLSIADRLELLDNAWVFASDGKAPLASYLAYMKADAGDTETHVAGDILGYLGQMNQYEYGKPSEAAFKKWAADSYLKPLLAALGGWDGESANPEVNSLRQEVIGTLAEAGDDATIAQARKRFAEYQSDPKSLTPGMKNTVYGIVGRYADAATYNQLIQMGMSAKNPLEMQTDFGAAFSAKDPALAKRSLEMSTHLPAEFAQFGPIIVAIVGQDHPEMAWAFLKANSDSLFKGMSLFSRLPYVSGVASSFWRGVSAADIDAYLKANMPPSATLELDKAMETVNLSQRHRAVLVPQINAFVASTPD